MHTPTTTGHGKGTIYRALPPYCRNFVSRSKPMTYNGAYKFVSRPALYSRILNQLETKKASGKAT